MPRRTDDEIKRMAAFFTDYQAICEKHDCMILSDGEPVEIVPRRLSGLWGIEEHTERESELKHRELRQ